MDNQVKILTAFKNLLKTTDYDNLSILKICDEAKVSPSTFYHYYHSKVELILGIYQNVDDYFLDQVLNECLKLTPYDSLISYLSYIAIYTEKIGLTFIKNIYKAQITNSIDYFTNENRGINKGLKVLLERAINSETIETDNINKLEEQLLELVRGVTYNWCIKEGKFNLVNETREVLSNYLSAFVF